MAYSLNKVQIIGNLTRDPEVRTTPSGQQVANFGVATNFTWTDQKSGQRKDKTEFHNIVTWRKLAEICAQYLKKGMKVYIEGRLQTRDWEGEDGVKRYRTEIIADNMIMLDRKNATVDSGENIAQEEPFTPAAEMTKGLPAEARRAETGRSPAGIKKQKPADKPAQAIEPEDIVKLDDLPF